MMTKEEALEILKNASIKIDPQNPGGMEKIREAMKVVARLDPPPSAE